MKFCRACLLALATTIVAQHLISPAMAASRFVVDAIYNPATPTDTSTLRGGAGDTHANVTVTCYYKSSVSSICTGGGDFDTKQSCSDSDNGATIIKDSTADNNCFYRKNFGLNGVVDARQCGVVGNGTTDDYVSLNQCLTLASSLGIRVVNTGSGVILDNTASIVVPNDTELTCGGNSTGTAHNNDYRISNGLTNAIAIDPSYGIQLSNDNSSVTGCTLEAGAGASNANPYSPSAYYPKCTNTWTPPSMPCTNGSASLRSSTNEYSAFNALATALYPSGGPAAASVGITVTGEHDAVREVTVLGFGTCYKAAGGKRLEIDHLLGDCNTGLNIDSSPDATQFNGFTVSPFLTRNNGDATATVTNVTAVAADTAMGFVGEYRITAEVGSYTLSNGDTIWIGMAPSTGSELASGRWIIENSSGTSSCGSTTCQSFTLHGSIYSATAVPGFTGTANVSTTVNNGVPPTALTGVVSAHFNLVSVGQVVTDSSSCVPGGTTVADVWPAQQIVYLSATPTCAHTADTVTFTDGNFSTPHNCGTAPINDPRRACLTVNANTRFGEGIVVTNSGGVSAVNCQTFDHQIAYHLYTGANNVRFANCITGENVGLPDPAMVGLQIDGDHTGNDG